MKTQVLKKDGYRIHFIKTTNFKSIIIKTIFWNKIKKEDITMRNVLFNSLLFSSKKYPSSKEVAKKRADLYGANLMGGNYRKGPYIFTEMNMSVIEDKYIETGNLNKALEFYFDTMFDPNVKDNVFDKENFKVIYDKIESSIKMEKENPVSYSFIEYKKLLNNELYSLSLKGTLKDLSKINPINLYEYYKNFFKNNYIDILVIGNFDNKAMEKSIDKYFKVKGKNYQKDNIYLTYNKDFSEHKIKSDFNQSRLIMGGSLNNFTDTEKKYTQVMYNIILGSSPNSKLFKNVREKYSYAYNISSSVNRIDNLFIVQAGISKENYESTKKEVLKQIEEMKKGNFAQKDINDAKTLLLSIIKEFDDYQYDMLEHHFSNYYFETDDLDTQKEKIKSITKDDIVKVAKKINIDTILLMEEASNERN